MRSAVAGLYGSFIGLAAPMPSPDDAKGLLSVMTQLGSDATKGEEANVMLTEPDRATAPYVTDQWSSSQSAVVDGIAGGGWLF